MPELIIYNDIKKYYDDTYEILLRDEVKNLIILGNLLIGMDGTDRTGWRNVDNWFMAAVKDEGKVVLSALMTPPMNLALYETDNVPNDAALKILAEGIADKVSVPGVISEKDLGLRFAKVFGETLDKDWKIEENQRIYALTEVNEEYLKGDYTFRPAGEQDMSFLPYWDNGFQTDCFGRSEDMLKSAAAARHHLDIKRLYILEDNGVAVTMAGNHRNMLNVGGVGPVYTPPYFRARGYASACVARLSQQILDNGKKFCVLYTNLANPISNSIYQKIGYKAICDSIVIKFTV